MPVRHGFQSTKADGTDTTLVRPSDWNADHVSPPVGLTFNGAAVTWTNMPAALTAFIGSIRYQVHFDATHVVRARVVAGLQVAGAAGAELRLQYFDPGTSAFVYADGVDGPKVAVDTTGACVGAWSDLAAGAKADRVFRVAGINGNGAADPQFGLVTVQFW